MSNRDSRLAAAAQDGNSGANLVRMLIVGLALIVLGMVAVVLIV
ncbi:MAG: hypothetical protein AB7T86_06255 [Xanthobacteraceae bacterium]|jgi:hypothetical protein